MELQAQWHNPKEGAADLDAGRWRVLRDGQDSMLRVTLARLTPGTLRVELLYGRRFIGPFRCIASERIQKLAVVQQLSSQACDLDLQLTAAELGLQGSFVARMIEVRASLLDAHDKNKLVRATRRVYIMPYRQFLLARVLRALAILPLLPLLVSLQAGEISGEIAIWYGAMSAGVGLLVQEHPLSRISQFLREATRGALAALITIAILVGVQWTLLVRITNSESRPLVVSGASLDAGKSRVTWAWSAPTLKSLNAESGNLNRFSLKALRLADRELRGWAPWRTLSVGCKPFRVECERTPPSDPTCPVAASDETQTDTNAISERTSKDAVSNTAPEPIELGPNCSIPGRVRTKLESWVVLGRASPNEPFGPDDMRVCNGSYELALSEQKAYSDTGGARAQYAKSFAMLVLPKGLELQNIDLHWTNNSDESNGFVSATVSPREPAADSCITMFPVRNGSFDIELRGPGGGMLHCPSVGSCKTAYAIRQVFSVTQPEFDGMLHYSVDHGRSVWTPLGDSAGAYECACWGEEQRPKQSTLRLARRAPQSLRLQFSPNTLPTRLDISAGDQRSSLQCTYPGSDKLNIQPLRLGYTDKAQRVEVTPKEEAEASKWLSEWTWLEGEHQAWSCTSAASPLSIRVDSARSFDYQRNDAGGDGPKLPVCYLHRSGAVTYTESQPAQCNKASDEYQKLVRKDYVCAEVQACP